ncbi:MAG: FxLYD domain-containing protein [Candidatus Brocadiales bacterium]
MHLAYGSIKPFEKILWLTVSVLCVFSFLTVLPFAAMGEEQPPSEGPQATEDTVFEEVIKPAFEESPAESQPAEQESAGNASLEQLEPVPVDDLFAIKLLEKIIELEDAFKFLAREVGGMSERLTIRMEETEERITKLEESPPSLAHGPAGGEPYTPPPPVQARFEVGKMYLGEGFNVKNMAYETTPKGTVFTGQITNNGSAPRELAEFEIVAFGENDKMIGTKAFKITDFEVGETRPFEVTVKGPKANWITKYDFRYMRGE